MYSWFPVLDLSLLSTTVNITRNYCMCITGRFRVMVGVHINKTILQVAFFVVDLYYPLF